MGERTGAKRVIARRPEGPTKQSPTRHDEIASGASRPRNDEPPFVHPLQNRHKTAKTSVAEAEMLRYNATIECGCGGTGRRV